MWLEDITIEHIGELEVVSIHRPHLMDLIQFYIRNRKAIRRRRVKRILKYNGNIQAILEG